ncbi:hypothetical protein [uncultured Clostridium sp.]|uniref:hypothetical protein n=1 Tax=uncultured Clostridium sp. TaxID=59620 RepID=UPI00272C60C6|nr:hypothetical protein [uncultured Clostridium sp.]
MAKQYNKDDILYLHFHIEQKFNPRQINKLDKNGKPITLISLGFPYQSQYNGCYISVNNAFIKDDKYHLGKRQQISMLANAPIKVYKYDPQLKQAEHVTTLLGKDIVKEFDAWKTQEVN